MGKRRPRGKLSWDCAEFVAAHDAAPTYKVLCKELGKSFRTVRRRMQMVKDRGYTLRKRKRGRRLTWDMGLFCRVWQRAKRRQEVALRLGLSEEETDRRATYLRRVHNRTLKMFPKNKRRLTEEQIEAIKHEVAITPLKMNNGSYIMCSKTSDGSFGESTDIMAIGSNTPIPSDHEDEDEQERAGDEEE